MSSALPAPIRPFRDLESGRDVAVGPGKADLLQAIARLARPAPARP